MKSEQLMQIFSDNLAALRDTLSQKSGAGVHRRTGVAPATVNFMISGKHAAHLGTIAKLADGFKVPPWVLLHPNGLELIKDKRLATVMEQFASASDEGRAAICRTAEIEAHYSKE